MELIREMRPELSPDGLPEVPQDGESPGQSGGPGRIRTCDPRFRRAVLYPLSYEGMAVRPAHSLTVPG